MTKNRQNELLSLAISPSSVQVVGRYTIPKSYGVYRLKGSSSISRRVRFGNHPVREEELAREYDTTEIVALFLEREHAKELASLLNGDSR